MAEVSSRNGDSRASSRKAQRGSMEQFMAAETNEVVAPDVLTNDNVLKSENMVPENTDSGETVQEVTPVMKTDIIEENGTTKRGSMGEFVAGLENGNQKSSAEIDFGEKKSEFTPEIVQQISTTITENGITKRASMGEFVAGLEDTAIRSGSQSASIAGSKAARTLEEGEIRPDSAARSSLASGPEQELANLEDFDENGEEISIEGNLEAAKVASVHATPVQSVHASVNGSRQPTPVPSVHASANGSRQTTPVQSVHASREATPVQSVHASANGSRQITPVQSVHASREATPVQSVHASREATPVQSAHASREATPVQSFRASREPTPVQSVHASREPTPVHASREPTSVQSVHASREPTPVQSVHASREPTPVQSVHASREPTPVQSVHTSREPTPVQSYRSGSATPQPPASEPGSKPGSSRVDGLNPSFGRPPSYPGSTHESKGIKPGSPQVISGLVTSRSNLVSNHSGEGMVSKQGSVPHDSADSERPPSASSSIRRKIDYQEALKVDELEIKLEALQRQLSEKNSQFASLEKQLHTLRDENSHYQKSLHELSAASKKNEEDSKKRSQNNSASSNSTTSSRTTKALDDDTNGLDLNQLHKRVDQLISERENLATELAESQAELVRLRSVTEPTPLPSHLGGHVLEYNPDNPATLRRKIKELEHQIQDLQEANECNQQATPLKMATTLEHLHVENRVLREEVEHLRAAQRVPSSHHPSYEVDSGIRAEIDALRAEMASLRRENRDVNTENMKLKEGHGGRHGYSGDNPGDQYQYERGKVLDEVSRLRKELSEVKRSRSPNNVILPPAHSSARMPPYTPPVYAKAASFGNLSSLESPKPGKSLVVIPDQHARSVTDTLHETRVHSIILKEGQDEYRSPYNEVRNYFQQHPAQPSLRDSLLPRHHTPGAMDSDASIVSESSTLLINDPAPRNTPKSRLDRLFSRRRDSGGESDSGSTESMLSDVERELEDMEILPSAGGLGGKMSHRRTRQGLTNDRQQTSSPLAEHAGFRSITPRPIATQHNREEILRMKKSSPFEPAGSFAFSTVGRHPFAPRSPGDINIDDLIKFTRQGGRISRGLVHFIGHLPGRHDAYIGVELELEDGKHDGIYEDRRYFQCKPDKGVFVAFNKVIMCYGGGV